LCGTGKSHLAQALGHCAVRQGVDVVFTTCATLTASLNAARAIGAYDRKLAALARVPLLIVDDFGLKPLRPPADEDLHDLIAERYEAAATIVTSNQLCGAPHNEESLLPGGRGALRRSSAVSAPRGR
jgi:DNA replication protein DnaC